MKRSPKPKNHQEAYFVFNVLSKYRVMIVFTDNIKDSVAYLADRDNFNYPDRETVENCQACHLHPGQRGHSYLLFPHDADAGTIVHECWHVIYNMAKWAGIGLEEEFVAYHIGYTVQKVVDFQTRLRRKGNDRRRTRKKTSAGRNGRSLGNGE